jgi:hypothetical protein
MVCPSPSAERRTPARQARDPGSAGQNVRLTQLMTDLAAEIFQLSLGKESSVTQEERL